MGVTVFPLQMQHALGNRQEAHNLEGKIAKFVGVRIFCDYQALTLLPDLVKSYSEPTGSNGSAVRWPERPGSA
jgi:hypothetical protein